MFIRNVASLLYIMRTQSDQQNGICFLINVGEVFLARLCFKNPSVGRHRDDARVQNLVEAPVCGASASIIAATYPNNLLESSAKCSMQVVNYLAKLQPLSMVI